MSSTNVARSAVAVYLSSCEHAKTSVIVEFLDALHDGSRQCFLSDRQPPLNDADIACISSALKQPHHMRVLDLYSNDISAQGVGSLLAALIERPNTLRELRLGNVNMDDNTAQLIAETFSQNQQIGLRVLDMSQNQISDSGCNALAATFSHETSPVLELSLHSNHLTSGSANAITRLAACDRIRHLHLGRNQLGDATAIQLAQLLPSAKVISTLDLSENNIGVDGGIALARTLVGQGSAINNGVCLQRLNLRGNLLDAEALSAFVQVVQENRNLTQLFVGCNEGQPPPDQTQAILSSLLENDVLLLLDIVGWPLPAGTAWEVADSILSSNTGVRAVVSDAFDDVFEFIDGANHDRTQRGQQSIYFGVNEYIGASAVAAAAAHNAGSASSMSMKAGSTNSANHSRSVSQRNSVPSDGANNNNNNNGQQPQFNDRLPPANLDGSHSRSPPRSQQQQDQNPTNQNQQVQLPTSQPAPPLEDTQRPPLAAASQQQQQSSSSASFNNNNSSSVVPRSAAAGGVGVNNNNNSGTFNTNNNNQQQQQQQQAEEKKKLQDTEREIDDIINSIEEADGENNNNNNNNNTNVNQGRMAQVLSTLAESLRRAHERIDVLERRDAQKEGELQTLRRQQQQQQQQQQSAAAPAGSSPPQQRSAFGNNNNSNIANQQQQQQQQQVASTPYNQQQAPRGFDSNDNNNTNSSFKRRGEPGAAASDNNNNISQSSSPNNVPPLRLGNVTNNNTNDNNNNNNRTPGSPIKALSSTVTKGPGGATTTTSASSSPNTTYRTNDNNNNNNNNNTDYLRSASNQSTQSSSMQPTLHPYWKNSTPERARQLESARDRPEDDNFNHASSLPHAANTKDRNLQQTIEDKSPAPNLQHSQKVEPSMPLMKAPPPQTPPPRPTVPRATA